MVTQLFKTVRWPLFYKHLKLHKNGQNYPFGKTYLSDVSSCSNKEFMLTRYNDLKKLIENDHEQVCNVDPKAVFAINQINLGEVKVYGFDYDYTLAQYADIMQDFIYEAATKILVQKHHFPRDLLNLAYIPKFCIRGLHYDIQRSLLMKVDICNMIQLGTVYKGLRKLEDDEVKMVFSGSRHIPKTIIDQSYAGGDNLRQLMDIFSMPEIMLLANAVHYFTERNIVYDPRILFESVQDSVRSVHTSGLLYGEVQDKISKYLVRNSLTDLFNYLTSSGKKLFLITNSNFSFVNCGMEHLIGSGWQDAFDIVIVQAKKPRFFQEKLRPFKRVILDNSPDMQISWDRVHEFKKGEVYCEGCIEELMKLSGWAGNEVLYFGDQIYADLSDLTYAYGWRTGAVIPELEEEIAIMNTKLFGKSVIWLQTLERLLERMQIYRDAESQQVLRDWLNERDDLKVIVKEIFNPHFGSVFRSHLSASFFTGRLCRIADIYTSRVTNLLHYYPNHFFFPVRGTLAHEHIISLAYQHDGFDYAIERALRDKRTGVPK
ncbi:5'-nucleotidase domain-containing protein 3-like [Clavelina lepadiformis]|uniref:5'-nucleotidase domain-containing protein 3-like n=1 Tax=Clavelina lepadiformis TaxID=159417 RepID=UPI004042A975